MNRRSASFVGWALVGSAVLFSVGSLVIAATNPTSAIKVAVDLETETSPMFVSFAVAISLTFAVVGAVIISKRPENGLGWAFALGGMFIVMDTLVTAYGYRAVAVEPGSLPAGRIAAWIGDIVALVGFGFVTVFLFLLFPEGRLRTRAERRTASAAIAGIGFYTVAAIVEPTLEGYGDIAPPLGLDTPAVVFGALWAIGYLTFIGALITSVVLLIRRLRRAVGRERDQLRILAWAAVVAIVTMAPVLFLPGSAMGGYEELIFAAPAIGILLIPVSVGVAILRHHLLDIDLVIRRTVVIAVLGVFITSVYVGIVVGVGAVVGNTGNAVLSAMAAAVVALAFQPARRWAQRVANRFVYGKRASPYEVLHEFSERVAGSYETEDVLPRMAAILGQGTGAERAQIWLRIGGQLRATAVWPAGVGRSSPVATGGELPLIADVSYAVPVRDRNELLGALSVTKPTSDPVTPSEEKLVSDLALQAGLVLRNVRLVEDLRASRGRLVAAQDEERRKLERNIHDGAQQHLVALAIKAKLAESFVEKDVGRARGILAEVQAESQEALESLRDLARGIYPPLLVDEGIAAALKAQTRRAPMPVTVHQDNLPRYPQEVEATAYFCCLEALQNASKYSEASAVTITLSASDGLLRFEVRDDGRGFDPASTSRGSGLQNMSDRLEAVGGELQLTSAPGEGTALAGTIPTPRPS